MLTVVLTGNMPNGGVTLVNQVTWRVTIVTCANYWHVVLRQQHTLAVIRKSQTNLPMVCAPHDVGAGSI